MTIPNLSPLSQPPSFGAPDFSGRADTFLGDLVTLRNELTAVIVAINSYVPPIPAGTLREDQNLNDVTDKSAARNNLGLGDSDTARANLGLRIGHDVQAYNSRLSQWAGVDPDVITSAINAAQTAANNAAAAVGGRAVVSESSEISLGSSGGTSVVEAAHGLGQIPKIYYGYLLCKQSDNGVSAGTRLRLDAMNLDGMYYVLSATNSHVRLTLPGSIQVLRPSDLAGFYIDKSKWRAVFAWVD